VEQKNWAVVRALVGYHRYDTAAELLLLNKNLQSHLNNYFLPQQKLISKVRDGATVTKGCDPPDNPAPARGRAQERQQGRQGDHERDTGGTDPAAIQRQIQALTQELLIPITSEASAASSPS